MTARSIAVALLVAVSFCMAFLRWKFTVLAEIGRISAISATVLPSADQRKISISRSVKDALNNSFPGVLRLGYFSDGANLS